MIGKINEMLKNKKGFTLIELIVVIAIIGILAAIAAPKFSGFTDSAKTKADAASVTTINNAIKIYCVENDKEALSVGTDIADTNADTVIDFLQGEKLLDDEAKLNNPSNYTYNATTNKLE